MKRSNQIVAGIAVSLGLAFAAVAYAHPGQGGWGHMGGGYGMMGGMGPGAMAGYGAGYGAQLMTPEERAAFREKMRNATPEERQKLAEANHAEMQKRAQEKGITLPERRGPGAGYGPGAGPCWTAGTAQ